MTKLVTLRRCPLFRTIAASALLLGAATHALAISELKLFQEAPSFDLKDLQGNSVTSASLKGHTVVLVFGELYNRYTLEALKELQGVISGEKLQGEKISVFLIVAERAQDRELQERAEKKNLAVSILHDPERRAYGAYGVIVLPSTVVLDGHGLVCAAISGYPLAYADIVSDALLYATGKLSREAFEGARKARRENEQSLSESELRSQRLAALARQLLRRGYPALAVERFREALKADSQNLAARIGLGRAYLTANHLADAEKELRAVLSQDPTHLQANLAMTLLELLRGGSEVRNAAERIKKILLHHPHNAEAYYLLGRVSEKQGETQKALKAYRKAAELLLQQTGL